MPPLLATTRPSPTPETWSHAESHPDGFMAVEAVRDMRGHLQDLRWRYLNPAAEALLGLHRDEVLDHALLERLPELSPHGLHARFTHVVETGEPCVEELALPVAGRERWFRFVLLKQGDGLSIWFTDTTRRRREQLETGLLAELGHLLTASLDLQAALHTLARRCVPMLADGCMLQVLMEGRGPPWLEVVASAPHQEALLVEALRRQPGGACELLRQLLPPEAPARLAESPRALLEALGAEGSAALGEQWGAHALLAVPLRARGRTLGALVLLTREGRGLGGEDLRFATELADRLALSVDNALLLREAHRAVAQRDEFFTLAAHELRTPTTALKLSVQSLLRATRRGEEEGPLTPDLQSRLDTIDRTAGRLTTLVNELLDVTRLHSGRLRLSLEPVDLSALVREVATRFTLSPLELELADAALGQWDRTRLEQVVTHLLSNALKYGTGRPVHVSVEVRGEQVRLVVRDESIGIPPEHLPRLFNRFERTVSERPPEGMGLGLYITRRVVEALGGRVEVHSAPGAGATFSVELPREPGA